MKSEFVLPELPPDHIWDAPNRTAAPFIIKKVLPGKTRNMAYVNGTLEVKVWKAAPPRYRVMGKGETIQQALNMAAALVALGEADE